MAPRDGVMPKPMGTATVLGLGSLVGAQGRSRPYGINDAGQVVGWSDTTSDDNHAFLWDPVNGMRDLSVLDSVAMGINNAGQVVGASDTMSDELHAFLWDEEHRMRDLGTLGGETSVACGINDAGQVVGQSETTSDEMHAFLWDEEHGMRDLGTVGGEMSFAWAINNAGLVVVSSMTSFAEIHTFLWDPVNSMQNLGSLGGNSTAAQGINDAGQVVGQSVTTSDEVHAFLWDEEHGMRDLNDLIDPNSGWTLRNMIDLNEEGAMVGEGEYGNVQQAVLVTWGGGADEGGGCFGATLDTSSQGRGIPDDLLLTALVLLIFALTTGKHRSQHTLTVARND
ncbi:MAG TPA: hypothetical protein VMZ06_18220 [Candidatus Bathyarchaeia archaeon]|nr:hypothetical protein [Candidatus Bathyarchaeia archaeon]